MRSAPAAPGRPAPGHAPSARPGRPERCPGGFRLQRRGGLGADRPRRSGAAGSEPAVRGAGRGTRMQEGRGGQWAVRGGTPARSPPPRCPSESRRQVTRVNVAGESRAGSSLRDLEPATPAWGCRGWVRSPGRGRDPHPRGRPGEAMSPSPRPGLQTFAGEVNREAPSSGTDSSDRPGASPYHAIRASVSPRGRARVRLRSARDRQLTYPPGPAE